MTENHQKSAIGDSVEAVGPGSVLGGRYDVTERIEQNDRFERWRARDTSLGRDVSITVLPSEGGEPVLDAARRAAGVSETRLLRILDVGKDGSQAWVAEQSTEGARSLAELARDAQLAPEETRRMVGEAARALETAAARGLHHGLLTPHDILRAEDGAVLVRGVATAAALADKEQELQDGTRVDATDLVHCLYYGMTGHWSGRPVEGLPGVEETDGSPVAPSDVMVGVPIDIDLLCRDVLAGNDVPQDPADLARRIAPWSRAVVNGPGLTTIASLRDGAARMPLPGSETPAGEAPGAGAEGTPGPAAAGGAGPDASGPRAAAGGAASAAAAAPGRDSHDDLGATQSMPGVPGPAGTAGTGVAGAAAPGPSAPQDDETETPADETAGADEQDRDADGRGAVAGAAVAGALGGMLAKGRSAAERARERARAASEKARRGKHDPGAGGLDALAGMATTQSGEPLEVIDADPEHAAPASSGDADANRESVRDTRGSRGETRGDRRGRAAAAAGAAGAAGAGATAYGTHRDHDADDLDDDAEREPLSLGEALEEGEAAPLDPAVPIFADQGPREPTKDESKLALAIVGLLVVLALVWGISNVLKIGQHTEKPESHPTSSAPGPTTKGTPPPSTSGAPTSAPPSSTPAVPSGPVNIVAGTAIDPEVGDAAGVGTSAKAYDGDANTMWKSRRWWGSPNFNGSRDGIGLSLDLGSPQNVTNVKLNLPADQTGVVYVSDNGTSIAGAKEIGTFDSAGEKVFNPTDAKGQFVIVWVTKAGVEPGTTKQHRAMVSEVSVEGSPTDGSTASGTAPDAASPTS